MYDNQNIFARILRNEIACNKVYEDDISLFFYDINPLTKVHVLGIPKILCEDFSDFIIKSDSNTQIQFFKNINIVINKLNLVSSGYRLISNSGIDGGQEVPHFHIHILGGEKVGLIK
ncbi:HIT domain-containing protein [Pelagibacteraceae bacterium]|nr:HIT domain-containing protein [Pelagibacteraceae bacterium]